MKLLFILLFGLTLSFAQKSTKITTLETVEILNENRDEAIFYYENNWKHLRVKAIQQNFIHSFQILETTYSDETPFHLVLMTTYYDAEQYKNREEHFAELINQMGSLKLLNTKKPSEFRRSVFAFDGAKHLN